MTKHKRSSPIFTAPSLPAHYVNRPREYEAIARMLIPVEAETKPLNFGQKFARAVSGSFGKSAAPKTQPTVAADLAPIAITTALQGGGGFGKTTLALALCHDERIRRAYPDGVLWIAIGEKPDLASLLINQIKLLTDEPVTVGDINAARARLRELIDGRRILIVLDDVWQDDHARQFLDGGPYCARLITTRRQDVVARLRARQPVEVNEMQTDEAASLLVKWLDRPPTDLSPFRQMARELGEWPLLLELAGSYLREAVTIDRQTPVAALSTMRERLRIRGFTAFDRQDEAQRNTAIRASLNVSLERLGEQRERFQELAVFPEDTAIPFVTIFRLWQETAGLSEAIADDTLKAMQRLSLFTRYDPLSRTMRLHDVIRALAQAECRDVRRLHDHLLDAHRRLLPADDSHTWGPGWAGLSQDESYLWDHLAYHLQEAGRAAELIETVKDLRYLAAKVQARKVLAAETDLVSAIGLASGDVTLSLLRRSLANMTHLLNRCVTPSDIGSTLQSRLMHVPELTEACRVLENQMPRPCVVAWRILPDLPRPALVRTFGGQGGMMTACALSPDGQWIVSGVNDGTLRVWDMESGAERRVLTGHTKPITACVASPDGQWIVSASLDNTLKIWDAATGLERQTLRGHTQQITACTVSPDSRWIVSASYDETLKVWEANSGKERLTLKGHTGWVNDCAVSPDGQWIVSASTDKTLRIWDVHTGMECRTFTAYKGAEACAVSPDGQWIVLASDDTLVVLDVATGAERLTLRGHTSGVSACAVSPGGQWIVSASWDNTLKVWDAISGVELRTLIGHTNLVMACVVSLDGQWIVSASLDETLKVWAITSETEDQSRKGHSDKVNACAMGPGGQWLVSASADRTLKVWDVHTGMEQRTLTGHTSEVSACAVSPDGKWIVSASASRNNYILKIWDVASGTERCTLTGHHEGVTACAVSPDGQWIVSASYDKTIKIWDLESGTKRRTLAGHSDGVRDCTISPDGQWVVSASGDHTLKVWDASSGAERLTLKGHSQGVNACAVSPDGQWIVSASYDETLKVWEASSGAERLTLKGHAEPVNACAVSADGQWIASTSDDLTLKIWEMATGVCAATFHTDGKLESCAWLPDGERLVAVGARGIYWLKFVH